MLHHVSVGVSDVERAARFYDPVLAALGYRRVMEFLPHGIGYGDKYPSFWVQVPHNRNAATVGNGVHVGFSASSKEAVMKFHEAALKAGGSNNGEPGPRPDYGPDYYGAFVYDLDGNKIEATLHAEAGRPGPAVRAARKAARAAAAGTPAGAEAKAARRAAKKAKRKNKTGGENKDKAKRKDKKAKKAKKAEKAEKAKRG